MTEEQLRTAARDIVQHLDALLAEVERLQAENADLLAKNANMSEALQSASTELLEDIGPRFAKQTAQNAAMREIVQAVADGRVGLIGPLEIESGIIPSKIDADDLRDKARAIQEESE